MPIALQPDGVNLRYFKLTLLDYQNSQFVGKTQLYFHKKTYLYFRFTMAGKNMLFIKNSKGKQIF